MEDDFEDFDDIADEDLLTALNAATSVQDTNHARNSNPYPGSRSTVNQTSATRSIGRPPNTQRNSTVMTFTSHYDTLSLAMQSFLWC